jgi:phage-related minor tail protein
MQGGVGTSAKGAEVSAVVFIVEAGASKDAGAPLVSESLAALRDLLSRGQVGDAEQSFRNVFNGKDRYTYRSCE